MPTTAVRRFFRGALIAAATNEISAFETEECGITQPGPPPGAPGSDEG